jgi:tubulin--tyrosine ligase
VAVSAIRVFLSQDCLALCSGTRYSKNDTNNLFAHITNTAYQDLDPNFREEDCILLWSEKDVAPILVRDGTCQTTQEAATRIQSVLTDMGDIVAELFSAYESEFSVFSPIEGCFEQYGLDFVVEVVGDEWQTKLLEVNPGPDFKQTGNRLQSAIEDLMSSTIDVALLKSEVSLGSTIGNLKLVYESQARSRGNISMKVS